MSYAYAEPSDCERAALRLCRVVTPVSRDQTKRSIWPFESPGTIVLVEEMYATELPSRDTIGRGSVPRKPLSRGALPIAGIVASVRSRRNSVAPLGADGSMPLAPQALNAANR